MQATLCRTPGLLEPFVQPGETVPRRQFALSRRRIRQVQKAFMWSSARLPSENGFLMRVPPLTLQMDVTQPFKRMNVKQRVTSLPYIKLKLKINLDYSTEIVLTLAVEFSFTLITGYSPSVEHLEAVIRITCACVLSTEKLKINTWLIYGPPGQSSEDNAETYSFFFLRQTLLNSESLILGDFNFRHKDWSSLPGSDGESHRMYEF